MLRECCYYYLLTEEDMGVWSMRGSHRMRRSARCSQQAHDNKANIFRESYSKANRLEFYTLTPDGLTLAATRTIYAQVTMLARLPAPANSPTDHLFVGTDQYKYFTLVWDHEKNEITTARSYVDISEPSARESESNPRCLLDPTGRFMTLEIYEGVVVVIPIVELSKRKGRVSQAALQPDAPQVGELGEPDVVAD